MLQRYDFNLNPPNNFRKTYLSDRKYNIKESFMASYPTPSFHKSVICDSFMKRDTDLRNGELPRNDFLRNTDSTDYTDVRKKFSLNNLSVKSAQLQISVAYFCSIGLYFLV